ncbi:MULTISPECIES: LptE family protein [unclassified Dysgonomonas]|uniref:LptE family protein n=1 Tax=unclassified Dysgonomonas TaxID=2630389 RepID=UPI0013ED9719|nr:MULTISPECIES: LptE family protein [unclassified Dysgonomonas]
MKKTALLLIVLPFLMYACSISYKFNGASLDYSKTKTIEIRDFPNQAPLVYPPLTQVFNDRIRDVFDRNTKLIFTTVSPDLEIEGEVTQYDLMPLSVQADAFAAETRLTMSVRMRFRNNVDPSQDKEETFTAFQDFDSSKMLTEVQDALIEELTKEIVDQIFNSTMSDW